MMLQRNDLVPQIEELYRKYYGILDPQLNLFQIDVPHDLMTDTFSDWKGVYLPDRAQVMIHRGTVNPGIEAIAEQEGGAAKTKNGFYQDIWVIGKHPRSGSPNFQHDAFVMRPEFGTKPITIYRLDRQGKITTTIQSANDIGINRHRASIQSDLMHIGPYGFGCSVSVNHVDHETEVALAKGLDRYKSNQKTFFSVLQFSSTEIKGL